jgi:hypothetical protein
MRKVERIGVNESDFDWLRQTLSRPFLIDRKVATSGSGIQYLYYPQFASKTFDKCTQNIEYIFYYRPFGKK